MSRFSRAPLSAVLGPTNTGKTHLAVERMLGHSSGMIGFPLRLLAREVYDRVVRMRGEGAAALVTGEERIWPETAKYVLCTAESMPLGKPSGDRDPAMPDDFAFVALDETQLGQDRERGHVFTARMLSARGRDETLILGAGTLAPVVRGLLPEAEIITRPRFSTLKYDGPRKLSRLPPRSVIVAFSVDEVYAIAEALRRFSGGAAVVMGALSPRTRNAQVDMFQAGEVDYLVATDAIGMGLNLDVAHVAFASLNKFDGVRQRRLTVTEMAQIAGRAGRHQRDGSFGSVGAEAAFTDEEVAAIEEHRFAPLDWLYWRNADLDFSSAASVIASLEAPPPDVMLRTAPEATDMAVIRRLASDAAATDLLDGADSVARLWSVCQLPDFIKAGSESHGRFVARLWQDLGRGNGHLPDQWFNSQLAQLDQVEGSVEALGDRIARVRTYCYMAQRRDWLADPADAAARAQAVETRLSDALHQALTARFVDRRTTVLLRALGQDASSLPVTVREDGAVAVDGEVIGHLDGFAFRVDPAARVSDRKMLLAAAERHLTVTLAAMASELAQSPSKDLSVVVDEAGAVEIHWRGHRVASLARGKSLLQPRIEPDRTLAILDAHILAAVTARLNRFVDDRTAKSLMPLMAIADAARNPDVAPDVRAIFAAVVDGCGAIERRHVERSLAKLVGEKRGPLIRMGVRVGSLDLFCEPLLKPAALDWVTALDACWRGEAAYATPPAGIVMVPATDDRPPSRGGSFRRIGSHWLRVDLVERIARSTHLKRKANGDVRIGQAVPPPPPTDVELPVEAAPMVEAAVPDVVAETAADVVVDAAIDGAAPTAPAFVPPPGSFQNDPELARSIGLTLDQRVTLLAQLGFFPVPGQPPVDIASEPTTYWIWRGRRYQPQTRNPSTASPSANAAAAKLRAVGAPKPRREVAFKAAARGKDQSRGQRSADSAAPAKAKPAAGPVGESPFAALAALLPDLAKK